jgi:phosphatidylserine decarboxylase
VNANVLFDQLVIPGCFFSKLVIPDFGGATTASTPYLAQVNARGLIVFETEDYGHVCCIPLGMSEVSSVVFNSAMAKGATVTKGAVLSVCSLSSSPMASVVIGGCSPRFGVGSSSPIASVVGPSSPTRIVVGPPSSPSR